MSLNDRILMLNDDLMIDPYFRFDFERNLNKKNDFFVINNSWSHFLISKEVVKNVGWFEERLLGIGWEDGDFMLRMVENNITPTSLKCLGIKNFVAPATNAGFSSISNFIGKYSEINKNFFHEKWHFNHSDKEIGYESFIKYKINFLWNNQELSGEIKDGMCTPIFYPFELLETNKVFVINTTNISKKSFLIFYYKIKNIMKDKVKKIIKTFFKK